MSNVIAWRFFCKDTVEYDAFHAYIPIDDGVQRHGLDAIIYKLKEELSRQTNDKKMMHFRVTANEFSKAVVDYFNKNACLNEDLYARFLEQFDLNYD